MRARLEWRVNNGDWQEEIADLGSVPIMLKSNRCHLEGLPPAALVKAKEESDELGGYFIVNGNEKIIRMLQVNHRNYPMAIKRGAFTNRGPGYTQFGIQIRSMRPDQTSQTNALHYLSDGNVNFRFSWRKAVRTVMFPSSCMWCANIVLGIPGANLHDPQGLSRDER
jgi:DNA-directed RNA polymerase I subunit RPA2